MRVRLRAGCELEVLNIADGGVLAEGPARLHPGAHVDVHVVTREGRVLVRSRVVRAFISHLQADLVRYRGALAFERMIDTTATEHASLQVGSPGEPAAATVNSAQDTAVAFRSTRPPLAVSPQQDVEPVPTS